MEKTTGHSADSLSDKMQSLTPEQLARVEALIATLQSDERNLTLRSLSEASFAAVWNDPANDVYDAL